MKHVRWIASARLWVTAAWLTAASLAASAAQAQDAYPSKPITLLVGFAPGGGTDQIARIVAPKVAELLKQPVNVENKTGPAARWRPGRQQRPRLTATPC